MTVSNGFRARRKAMQRGIWDIEPYLKRELERGTITEEQAEKLRVAHKARQDVYTEKKRRKSGTDSQKNA